MPRVVLDTSVLISAALNHDDVLADFPFLTRDDILACLAYAADRERQIRVAHA